MKKLGIILFVLLIPVALVATFVLDWYFPKIGEDARKPNKYDQLFYDTAVNNNDSSFCEKIYAKAYLAAAWSPGGSQVTYVKSKCYLRIAVSTINPSLCDNVQPVNTWFQDGSKVNEQECREEVRTSRNAGSPYGGNSLTFVDLESLFLELGYTEDMIPQSYWDEHDGSETSREFIIRQYWNDIEKTQDFRTRVNNLPDSTI